LKPIKPVALVVLISRTFSGRISPAATAIVQVAPTGDGLPLPLFLNGTTVAVMSEPVELCIAMQPRELPDPMAKASV